VGGGVKMVENRRFEIPEKSWHDSSLTGLLNQASHFWKKEEGVFGWNSKKTAEEANGISNRRF
jgi:hypothetical protein